MDPDATWAIITDVDSTPQERRDAALDLLVWLANGGSQDPTQPFQHAIRVAAAEAVIIAEFEYADRLAGR